MQKSRTRAQLKALDRTLLGQLIEGGPQSTRKTAFRNEQVKRLAENSGTKSGFRALKKVLVKAGTLEPNIETRRWVDTDKKSYKFTLARAASTDMWPMGTNYWVRDNVLIASRLLFGERASDSIKLGREILLSALTFMSSVAQLERFEKIVRATSKRVLINPYEWPHIFASISHNLNTAVQEPWSHKQDAWQMLAWYVLDAVEAGMIPLKTLSKKHRAFFGYIVPFLGKIRFWESENSGSWEEIPAVRTSVIAWEHMLVVRLAELSKRSDFRFLAQDFDRHKTHLGPRIKKFNLTQYVALLDKEATDSAIRSLPFEAPGYGKKELRYRTADSALIYLLQLEYPTFVAARANKNARWIKKVEKEILAQIESLYDRRTGGFYRYDGDSYQRAGYFRYSTIQKLAELYGDPSGDVSSHFWGRHVIVPRGRQAAWSHFTWQLSAWAGRRYLKEGDGRYLKLHEKYFREGLRMVTGLEEASIEQDAVGDPKIIPIRELLMPECYITDVTESGKELVFPTPHTPLNWSVAEMRDAFSVREALLFRRHQ